MKWFIVLLGIFWIIFGIAGLVATKSTTLALTNWMKKTRRQTLGLVSLILGVLLVLSAPSTKPPWFVLVFGIFGCLKGVTVILMPENSLKAIIDWWLSAPEIIYKGWATCLLVLGILMFHII